jgi:hypothetical protein
MHDRTIVVVVEQREHDVKNPKMARGENFQSFRKNGTRTENSTVDFDSLVILRRFLTLEHVA